jgi:hypothetical protein
MIKPPWAASVWANSDWIFADLNGHTVRVTNDEKGVKKILTMIRARDSTSKLGRKGDPTQWQIDKPKYDERMVRRPRAAVKSTLEQDANARAILRRLGMI